MSTRHDRNPRVSFGLQWSEFLLGVTALFCTDARVVQLHLGPLYCIIAWKTK